MFRLAVVLFAIVGCGLAEENGEDLSVLGVIGGALALPGQFPYQVSLQINGQQHCGGAIISNRHVVTAAHCIYQVPTHLMTVIAGTNDYAVGGQRRKVKMAKMHHSYYHQAHHNDIAIIEVDMPFDFNVNVGPINLPGRNEQPVGPTAIVSGFGVEAHGGKPSRSLKYAELPLLDYRTCLRIVPILQPSMICAGELHGQKNACPGDSGGPLVSYHTRTLVGVVSFGFGCGAPGAPAMYAYVGAFRDWIRQTTQV